MSDGLCDACRNDNHEHHKFALAGICVGCVCNWRPGRGGAVLEIEREDGERQVLQFGTPSLMRKEDVLRITENLALEELQKRVRLFPRLVAALEGLLREEWMTYEGNLEATGNASVDDLEAARAALAEAKTEGKS